MKKAIEFLKIKVDAGAQLAITQMIFDENIYQNFIEKARQSGVTIPIIPGIWPLDQSWKIKAAETKFKVKIPQKTKKELTKYNDAESFKKAGINEAIKLCEKLKQAKSPGIHLFVFQDIDLGKKIIKELKNVK